MSVAQALDFSVLYVLVLTRVAAMMLFAPMLGSSRIPRRVRAMFAVVVAAGVCGVVAVPAALPTAVPQLVLAVAGELAFGLAMGMVVSLAFVAVQWAGEMIGQQMGLTLGEVIDPQFGTQGSVVGDMYFMLALVVFLAIGGHRLMIAGVIGSFSRVPLLSVSAGAGALDLLLGMLESATTLAFRLAGPVLVVSLIIDVAVGLIGRAMPQFNVMAAGMSLRAVAGLAVVLVGIGLTAEIVGEAIVEALQAFSAGWSRAASM